MQTANESSKPTSSICATHGARRKLATRMHAMLLRTICLHVPTEQGTDEITRRVERKDAGSWGTAVVQRTVLSLICLSLAPYVHLLAVGNTRVTAAPTSPRHLVT